MEIETTPGSWFVADGGVCAVEHPKDGGNVICLEPECMMKASLARWPANARLIAAAPELLYVATLVTELTEVLGENNAVVHLARSAIAKVRGNAP